MKKTIKKIITASSLLITGMHFMNQYIDTSNTPVIPSGNDKTFYWKDMKLNYTEKGSENSPALLLLHNLYPSSSKEEWYRIDDTLSKYFHIFELDLPGCGKSEKLNITYTNYMFVQIVADFIKKVINKKTNICAAAFSSSFTLMTARMNPDIIDKIILINPTSINNLVRPVTASGKMKEKIIEIPVVGTFIYNCIFCKSGIKNDYKYLYFHNEKNVLDKNTDISYYNAHFGHSNGKYLFASILGNYTNINIIHALPTIKNEIYLISNGNHRSLIQEYRKYNKNIHAIYVSNCRLLPQLEIPETIISKIKQTLQ